MLKDLMYQTQSCKLIFHLTGIDIDNATYRFNIQTLEVKEFSN